MVHARRAADVRSDGYLRFTTVPGIPRVKPGDDVGALIADALGAEHVQSEAMTDSPRYRALSAALRRLRAFIETEEIFFDR